MILLKSVGFDLVMTLMLTNSKINVNIFSNSGEYSLDSSTEYKIRNIKLSTGRHIRILSILGRCM
jgi:pyridoxine 5'-phosphate synthase PdxJ